MKKKKYKPGVLKIAPPRGEYVPIEEVERILQENKIASLFSAIGMLFLGVFFTKVNNQSLPFLYCGMTFISCGLLLYNTTVRKKIADWKLRMRPISLK